jgi:hypothetical protein
MRCKSSIWFLAFLTALGCSPVSARDKIPTTSGFSGYFLLGLGYVRVESNLIVTGAPLVGDVGKPQTESIFASPPAGTAGALPTAGEINYTFAHTRTQLFFGNLLEDVLRLDVVFGLGLRQELPRSSIIAASLLGTLADLKFWSDPYIEGEDRQSTDLNFPGFRLRWGRILGTGFELTLTDRFYRFDDEKSGQWLLDEGRLDPSEQDLLDREGDILHIQALYRIDKPGHRFEPAIRLVRDHHKGEAISNDGYSLRLTHLYMHPKFVLDTNLVFGSRKAKETHPVYDQTLETTRLGIAMTTFVPIRLFDRTGWMIWVTGQAFKENANIDFFDSSAISVMAGLGWRHGRR